MSRAARVIFRLLGVVELAVDAYDWVSGLLRKKKPTVGDLLRHQTQPIPLTRRRGK